MTKASQATILSIAVPANPNIKIEAVYGFGEEDLKFLSDRGCEIIELSQSTIAAKLFTTGKQCPVIHKRLKSFEETEGEDIICPFFHDTEYLSSKITAVDDGFEHDNRMFITNQVKFFDEKEGKIYATPEFERWSFENNKPELRHPVSRKPLIIMDMLEDKGFETDIKTYTKEEKTLFEHDSKGLKTFTFQFYGFFSVVDFVALVNKKTEDGKKLFNIFSDAVAKERLTHKRRLTCGAWAKGLMLYSIITINNVKYRLKMDCVDISAASGNKSLDNVATQYGIKLPHKDLMKGGKIKRMHVVYHEEPDNYDKYALGDIDLKPIIIAMYQSLMELYSKKNVREYVPDELPLTAGKMVSHLEESKLCKDIGTILHPEIVEPKELKKFFVENYLEPSSPKSFAKLVQNNGYLLGKVIGGRCMNNFPNKHTFTGYITDMDLKGAYGVAMMNLDIPIGNPEIFESNKNTKKMTLRQWLKFVEQHSSNYWQVIVSSVDKLKHDCDFIPSFHPPQPTREIQSDDTVIGEIDFKDGTTRIYLREIYNGLINERVLDVINQLSKKHREDLLDSLVVECMVFYPNSTQVTEPEELKTKRIFKFDRRSKIGHYIHQTVGQNASWYAYPLKNIVGELQHIRNQYNKEKPDEKPMNEFA